MGDELNHLLGEDTNDDEVEIFLSNSIPARFDEELQQELQQELRQGYGIAKRNQPANGNSVKIRRIGYYLLAAAASFALLIFALNQWTVSPGNARELAASYLVESEIYHTGTTKGATVDQDERQRAIRAFNEKEYAKAKEAFARIEEKTEEDLFYNAICALFLEQYDTSITQLQQLAEARSNYSAEARWYLAIAHLLNANETEAKDLLLQMDSSSWNYEKTRQLLKAL